MPQETCSIEGCNRKLRARGWCSTHWARWSKHGDPLYLPPAPVRAMCSVAGCESPSQGRGWCKTHWARWRKYGDPTGVAPARPKVPPCAIADCGRKVSRQGLCSAHRHRLERHGDPLGGGAPRIIGDIEARFWSKVSKGATLDACWTWTGTIDARGYGTFAHRATGSPFQAKAHRWAYELLVGPIQGGLFLDHLCHDSKTCTGGAASCLHRRCVNPIHLRPVTNEENLRRAGLWILTEEQTLIAYRRCLSGETLTSVAASLGVHSSALSARFQRRGWPSPVRTHQASQ